ncbi:hypothetical protein Tco_1421708, partial [Tanacetum coccineum]
MMRKVTQKMKNVKKFGESDEEVQGENDVSRVSDTEVEEENP